MIDDLKPYPEYKDSDLAWLGQVPAHWQVRRLKTVLREIDRRSEAGREPLLSLRLHGGLVDHHALGGKTIPPSALVGYKHIKPGEIVMNRMRAALGLFAAAKTEGLVSPDYAIFHPVADVNLDYAVQLFRTPTMASVFRLESRGLGTGESGFLRLYSDRFGTIPIPLPPPDEQAAIVRFLGWATGQVDRAILVKRKVIDLLNEQKAAIIQNAVLRGTDETASLEETGIDWIGAIPAHWSLKRVCNSFRQVLRRDIAGDEPKMSMSRNFGLVRSEQLSSRAALSATSISYSVCWPNDLVVNKYQAHNGLFGAAQERGLITSNYSVFAPIDREFTPYYAMLFTSPVYRAEFFRRSRGVGDGMMPLYSDAFLKSPVVSPPRSEQEQIVSSLDRQLLGINTTISRLDREIELLREYRNRLVADVILGRLDVGAASRGLPETIEPVGHLPEASETDDAEEEVAA